MSYSREQRTPPCPEFLPFSIFAPFPMPFKGIVFRSPTLTSPSPWLIQPQTNSEGNDSGNICLRKREIPVFCFQRYTLFITHAKSVGSKEGFLKLTRPSFSKQENRKTNFPTSQGKQWSPWRVTIDLIMYQLQRNCFSLLFSSLDLAAHCRNSLSLWLSWGEYLGKWKTRISCSLPLELKRKRIYGICPFS